MKTLIESEKEIIQSQFVLAVKNLIEYMDCESDLIIDIVEEKEKWNAFEFSLEYPPYKENRQGFQRRVSNLEVEEFICNVLDNIEALVGCKYKRGEGFISIYSFDDQERRMNVTQYTYSHGNKLLVYKKVHIRILFVEER